MSTEQLNRYQRSLTNQMKQRILQATSSDGFINWDEVYFDIYDVLNAFQPVNEQVRHAVKKQLMSGGRSGGKSTEQDLSEALWSLTEGIKEQSTLVSSIG